MIQIADRFLPELFEFLRFPSISADPAFRPQILSCADWIAKKTKAMGLHTEIWPTKGNPVIMARTEKKTDRPTVLIYGHYDVQPPDPLPLWKSPPFEPTIKDGIITARGATDNKGQIFAHLAGVQMALEEKSDLPVNVIFLIEGEEEVASNLSTVLKEKKEFLYIAS